MTLPIQLPAGWTSEASESLGTVLAAEDKRGYVTVDERLRSFELGMCVVRKRGGYAGRNWKASLYRDAVAALDAAINY